MEYHCEFPGCSCPIPEGMEFCNTHNNDYDTFFEDVLYLYGSDAKFLDDADIMYFFLHQDFMNVSTCLAEESKLLLKFRETKLGQERLEIYQRNMDIVTSERQHGKPAEFLQCLRVVNRTGNIPCKSLEQMFVYDACWISLGELKGIFGFLRDERNCETFLSLIKQGYFGGNHTCRGAHKIQISPFDGNPMIRVIHTVDLEERFYGYLDSIRKGESAVKEKQVLIASDSVVTVESLASILGVSVSIIRQYCQMANKGNLLGCVHKEKFIEFARKASNKEIIDGDHIHRFSSRVCQSLKVIVELWENQSQPTESVV